MTFIIYRTYAMPHANAFSPAPFDRLRMRGSMVLAVLSVFALRGKKRKTKRRQSIAAAELLDDDMRHINTRDHAALCVMREIAARAWWILVRVLLGVI
jgi:hypothetical protein